MGTKAPVATWDTGSGQRLFVLSHATWGAFYWEHVLAVEVGTGLNCHHCKKHRHEMRHGQMDK